MLNAVGHAQINSATPAVARGIEFGPAQAQEIERLGRSVVRAETAALETLGDRIDCSFVDACRCLLHCRGPEERRTSSKLRETRGRGWRAPHQALRIRRLAKEVTKPTCWTSEGRAQESSIGCVDSLAIHIPVEG